MSQPLSDQWLLRYQYLGYSRNLDFSSPEMYLFHNIVPHSSLWSSIFNTSLASHPHCCLQDDFGSHPRNLSGLFSSLLIWSSLWWCYSSVFLPSRYLLQYLLILFWSSFLCSYSILITSSYTQVKTCMQYCKKGLIHALYNAAPASLSLLQIPQPMHPNTAFHSCFKWSSTVTLQ